MGHEITITMKTKYYFASSSLPELILGTPPELSFEQLDHLLQLNLYPFDYAQVAAIRRYFDFQNMKAFWREESLSIYGNYDENTLEEAILTKTGFPGYVIDFLEKYESVDSRLRHYPELIASYFREERSSIATTSAFLSRYLTLEREMRLVLVALRAKAEGRDLMIELQHEDPEDPFVAQLIAQKDAKTLQPPDGYEDLVALFESKRASPLELHQALVDYRFGKVSALYESDPFSIDRVLGYMVQLILVEQWMALNKAKGMAVLESIEMIRNKR